MVESFFFFFFWALRSTWAQIYGWVTRGKSGGRSLTVNLKWTMLGARFQASGLLCRTGVKCLILSSQQVRSLSFAGRFLENPNRLRQWNWVTRLLTVTANSVIGFSRPDLARRTRHPKERCLLACTLWWLCAGHPRVRRCLAAGRLTCVQPPPLLV